MRLTEPNKERLVFWVPGVVAWQTEMPPCLLALSTSPLSWLRGTALKVSTDYSFRGIKQNHANPNPIRARLMADSPKRSASDTPLELFPLADFGRTFGQSKGKPKVRKTRYFKGKNKKQKKSRWKEGSEVKKTAGPSLFWSRAALSSQPIRPSSAAFGTASNTYPTAWCDVLV